MNAYPANIFLTYPHLNGDALSKCRYATLKSVCICVTLQIFVQLLSQISFPFFLTVIILPNYSIFQ